MTLPVLIEKVLQCALSGGASDAECLGVKRYILELEIEADHRPATLTRARRIVQLEDELNELDGDERIAAICKRLGISRSTYYRTRALATLTSPS
ncbi:MAG: hypothetical protein QM808_16265 [Steroidobacteraceae bacterium]